MSIPRMSETTAMMEVTATTLPSTIMNERSLLVQTEDSATPTASRNWFIAGRDCGASDLHGIAVLEVPHGAERSRDDLIAEP